MNHACKEASLLASKSLDGRLGLIASLRLHLHLFVCRNCKNWQQNLHQLKTISSTLQRTDYGREQLPEALRQRIKQSLDQLDDQDV